MNEEKREWAITISVDIDEIPVGVDMCHRNDMLNISMSSTMDFNRHLRKAAVALRTKAQYEARGRKHNLHTPSSIISVSVDGNLCLELTAQLTLY